MAKSRTYTLEEKLRAAYVYCMCGNIREAARQLEYPRDTLKYWAKQEWWKDLMSRGMELADEQYTGMIYGLIKKGTKEVRDRLDNGDYQVHFDKLGEKTEYRIPIKGKEAADIVAKFTNQLNILRSRPTSIIQTQSIDKKIDSLDKHFVLVSTKDKNNKNKEEEQEEIHLH